jgi:hypothetical protein
MQSNVILNLKKAAIQTFKSIGKTDTHGKIKW